MVSKNLIFRKINKIQNLNFQAKNKRIIVMIDIFKMNFHAKYCQNSAKFNY